MSRKLGKRGMEDKLYFLMWEAIALVMVTIVIIVAVRGVAGNANYWKRYYTTDLSLMADIENVNQGDFVMNYELKDVNKGLWSKVYFINDKMFEFVLQQDRIEIYDYPKEKTPYPVLFPYSRSRAVTVQNSALSSTFLVLSKIGTVLSLTDFYDQKSAAQSSCPSVDTYKVLDEYTKFDVIALDDKSKPYADALKSTLGVYGRSKDAKMQFVILVAYDPDSNFTVYYPNDDSLVQGEKFACMMSQSYSKKTFDDDANYAVYAGLFDTNDAFKKYLADRQGSSDKPAWVIIKMNSLEKLDDVAFSGLAYDITKKYYEVSK